MNETIVRVKQNSMDEIGKAGSDRYTGFQKLMEENGRCRTLKRLHISIIKDKI